MKKQCMNPFLPLDKYIADGEPHVFNDRVYLFGSHDEENGDTYCKLNYEFFSAPVDDLSDWTSKGINYEASQDPLYSETTKYMYAPDCVKGNDGRFYLYYCLSGYKGSGGYINPISVAVSDSPDGKYEYLGFVRNKDGTPYLEHMCFDPALINDDGIIRLYFGADYPWFDAFPGKMRKKALGKVIGKKAEDIPDSYTGAYHVVLDDDMMTVTSQASKINPLEGKEYKQHHFFEGSSIRKINGKYYFIYSSTNNHELCYAVSDAPDHGFVYWGTIVSNGDIGYQGRKPQDRLNHTGTNHGSIECINGQWYVFYHRLTHNSDYSRQACAEKITITDNGSIPQVEITSCGLNNGFLKEGSYPAVVCCNLTNGKMSHGSNSASRKKEPHVTSSGSERYITQIGDKTEIAYKYFDLKGWYNLSVNIRGDKGKLSVFLNDRLAAVLSPDRSEQWYTDSVNVNFEESPTAVKFRYEGRGEIEFREFTVLPADKEKKEMTEKVYKSIHPGKIWNDTSGKPIQAHGFTVFYDENSKLYYWFGENKEKSVGGKKNTIWTYGIRLYTSSDLYNWEDKGLIIKPSSDLNNPLHPTYQIDRPHIIFCENTGKYVCWIKVMAGEVSQFMTILTADRLEGPYEMIRDIYKPLNMDSGDFTLHVDKETKKAYIFFERPHFQLITATLSDDYTECNGEYSVHYDGLLPPETRESPAYFERNGRKYLVTSGTSGYYPNVSRVCVFDDYHGSYKDLGNISVGDKSDTTFNSQICCVLQLPGSDTYIAMADRWMPQWYVPKMSKMIINGMQRHFKDYVPDTSEKLPTPLSQKETIHTENTSISRYVWLPLEWDGEKPILKWRDEWKTEEL